MNMLKRFNRGVSRAARCAVCVVLTACLLLSSPGLAMAAPKGIRTMPTEIFSLVQYPSDLGRASSFGVVVMSVTVLLTLLQRRFIDRRRFETVTGRRPVLEAAVAHAAKRTDGGAGVRTRRRRTAGSSTTGVTSARATDRCRPHSARR